MIYEREILIPFHLADPAGILFFGHVFTLAHESFEHYLQKGLDIAWADWFQHPEWIVPIKEAKAEYKHPIYVGIPCLIKTEIQSAGETSLQMNYQFIQHNHICCTVSTLHVFCDRKKRTKIPIPKQFTF